MEPETRNIENSGYVMMTPEDIFAGFCAYLYENPEHPINYGGEQSTATAQKIIQMMLGLPAQELSDTKSSTISVTVGDVYSKFNHRERMKLAKLEKSIPYIISLFKTNARGIASLKLTRVHQNDQIKEIRTTMQGRIDSFLSEQNYLNRQIQAQGNTLAGFDERLSNFENLVAKLTKNQETLKKDLTDKITAGIAEAETSLKKYVREVVENVLTEKSKEIKDKLSETIRTLNETITESADNLNKQLNEYTETTRTLHKHITEQGEVELEKFKEATETLDQKVVESAEALRRIVAESTEARQAKTNAFNSFVDDQTKTSLEKIEDRKNDVLEMMGKSVKELTNQIQQTFKDQTESVIKKIEDASNVGSSEVKKAQEDFAKLVNAGKGEIGKIKEEVEKLVSESLETAEKKIKQIPVSETTVTKPPAPLNKKGSPAESTKTGLPTGVKKTSDLPPIITPPPSTKDNNEKSPDKTTIVPLSKRLKKLHSKTPEKSLGPEPEPETGEKGPPAGKPSPEPVEITKENEEVYKLMQKISYKLQIMPDEEITILLEIAGVKPREKIEKNNIDFAKFSRDLFQAIKKLKENNPEKIEEIAEFMKKFDE